MIVACPNCQTRFNVPAEALEPDGRQVRCSRCHVVWFQEPEGGARAGRAATRDAAADAAPSAAGPAAGRDAAAEAETPIALADEAGPEEPPAADRADWDAPEPGSYDLTELDGEPIPRLPIQTRARAQRRRAQKRRGSAIGWYALLAAILAVLAVLWFGRAELVAAWPPIERLYVTAGIELPAPPLTLEFRDTATSFEDDNATLVVSGAVVNTGAAPQQVPPVLVVLLDSDGRSLVTRAVQADQASLVPGATTAFAARFENFPPAVADLRLTFQRP